MDWIALPAGVAAGLAGFGYIVWKVVRPIIKGIEFIEHELKENSGKSLRDVANRIEARLEAHDVRFDGIDSRLEVVEQRIRETGPVQVHVSAGAQGIQGIQGVPGVQGEQGEPG